ncbi:endonuclease [Meridianimarinicoccus roseus]|uniref:Endonuclease n=1 Tax=Meridianimarinicoccus roseus TaxID=2072018 RepID=A0A2V2LB11_9RHOB|nr:endonuclease/exonuclease/phosphatase family protein [Meridianimarinicoccus roseus]PWR02578.1 endonuclease [Meridianimarinicoccus roseus]
MKLIIRLTAGTLLLLSLVACALHVTHSGTVPVPPQMPGTLRIATHNVHYIVLGADREGRWTVADWEARRGALDSAFKELGADIVAFQEMESFSRGSDGSVNLARDWLLARNPAYAVAASGDWRVFPSTQPIFYRRDRLRLVDEGWFFFSDTPDVIYSRTFNGSYPAFCSWAVLQPLDGGPPLHVFNVHFEYSSRSNRRLSAELVRDRIAPRIAAGDAVVLAGDLNALHGARTMAILQEAGLDFPPVPGATFHFDRGLNLFGAIDHLGAGPGVRPVAGPVVLRRSYDGQWPSDHYPVLADFDLSR